MDRKGAILSAVALSALGAMFYNLLPLFLGMAQDYRELDNTGIGLLSSLFFAGHTLTTMTAFFWIRRLNWKTVSLLTIMIGSLALLLASYSQSHSRLMLCIFVAGGGVTCTGTGLGITYVITIVAKLDMDGRYVVLTVPAIGIGVMIAPAIGGFLTDSQDFSAIFVVGGTTVVLSLLAGLYALHKGTY